MHCATCILVHVREKCVLSLYSMLLPPAETKTLILRDQISYLSQFQVFCMISASSGCIQVECNNGQNYLLQTFSSQSVEDFRSIIICQIMREQISSFSRLNCVQKCNFCGPHYKIIRFQAHLWHILDFQNIEVFRQISPPAF